MNSIRPLISYSELLAARQHANLLLEDLREELCIIIDIDITINEVTKQKKEIKKLEKNILQVKELKNYIDKVFLQQAAQIEFQIDINYPQT